MKSESGIAFGPEVVWNAHPQWHWLELAGNPRFPDPLRIMFVAYGRHRANGHAQLDRGELAAYLVRTDGTMPKPKSVSASIDKAIVYGYLAEGSKALCLVVSSDHSQIGLGNPDEPCKRDHRRRERPDLRRGDRGDRGRFERVEGDELPSRSVKFDPSTSVTVTEVQTRTSAVVTELPRSAPLSDLPTHESRRDSA